MSNELSDLYTSMAMVLQYPNSEYGAAVTHFSQLVDRLHPEHNAGLNDIVSKIASLSEGEIEENYVRTFDVQAVCCLDVGYGMFGEDYKRGQFMAELKGMYDRVGIDMGCELPDFLPNILKLITKINFSDSEDLVHITVYPAIQKMIEGFGESENYYKTILETVLQILKKDYSIH